MKFSWYALTFVLIQALSFSAFGNIVISTEETNASNVLPSTVPGTGPNFFYSNISGIPDRETPPNWPAGTGLAGSCDQSHGFLVNPNCRDSSQNFNFSASDTVPTSGNSTMSIFYIAAGAPQPVPSQTTAIANLGTIVASFSYSANNLTGPSNLTFGAICNVLAGAGQPISSTCVPTDPSTPFVAQLYVVADANGDGIFESGESLLSFTFTVLSQIPINSSISNQTGFYGFQTFPGDSEVILLPSAIAEGSAVAGAYAVNFYYVSSSKFEPGEKMFSHINAEQTEPGIIVPFQQILLDSDGTLSSYHITGLDNGTTYYFRASLVDAAGNVGYMTPATDDLPANPPLPFQWHVAQPEGPK